MTLAYRSVTRRGLPLVLAFLVLSLGLVSSPQATAEVSRSASVIVRGLTADDAARAVDNAGGEVTRRLPIVDGVAAEVPSARLDALANEETVRQVTPNSSVDFQLCLLLCGGGSDDGGDSGGDTGGDTGSDTGSDTGTGSTSGAGRFDPYASSEYTGEITRSKGLWNKGITGKGVTVALIDTGVHADHPDLAGRVVHCEDFSHEAGSVAHCADTFGHGTFMAGLIAGNGASSGGTYKGSAPEANIVSVKLAGFDGAVDVSQVLAGIQWTVAHKAKYGIRVMNLSLGSDSTQSHELAPLNYAVKRAWHSGIVVVVSSGNTGPNSRTVTKPADDPYVITVGSSNPEGTTTIDDDQVPVFSSRGPTAADGIAKPDVVAPGVHTISLRSPGSAIDQQFGATAAVGDGYFRGTGTSMSTATTTGIVAQVLQNKPTLDPDQVKYRIVNKARRIATTDKYAAGKGIVDAYAAATSSTTKRANQYGGGGLLGDLVGTVGGVLDGLLGSLQGERGSLAVEVVTPAGEGTLSGEFSAQYDGGLVSLSNPLGLIPFSSETYAKTGWDPLSWGRTSFADGDWTAMKWRAMKWRETTWDAMKWRGTEWENADWDAMKWRDADWDAMKWRATTWQSAWYAAAWD